MDYIKIFSLHNYELTLALYINCVAFIFLNKMKYFICLITLFFRLRTFAQEPLKDKGNILFSKKNYIEALDVYKKLFKEEPDNIEYNYRLAFCYLKEAVNM